MQSVLNYLKSSANKFKNKIAVIEENKNITYEDLNNLSKKVGTYLIEREAFNEPIIIFMDKGINALISFFGSIYSGCYYSMINTELPESRIDQIKKTLKSRFVITDDEHLNLCEAIFKDTNILNINDLIKTEINEDYLKKRENIHIDYDPIYINFTSGSTGTPKGVVITDHSIVDFIDNFTDIFKFTSDDIIGNQAPFDFDVSVKDIYSAIKVGATLVIIPRSYFSSPAKLLDYIIDNNVTTLTWAVSALCLITTFHGLQYKVPTSVKKIIFSGEVMPMKHLNEWMSHLPDTIFVNVYGPTEITCNCTYHVIDRKRDYNGLIPIGKSFPNERVILLDEEDNEIKEKNKIGEICVCGACLSVGYFGNQEITNKNFNQNPLNKNYLENIYRTGDLAYYNDLEELVFMGRKDFQIKYMGHRIELEEIDKALMNIDEIKRSCTIFDKEKSKIYGFYIGDITASEIHMKLKENLPIYMIPTKLIKKDEFPLTKNGKIDRKLLMESVK